MKLIETRDAPAAPTEAESDRDRGMVFLAGMAAIGMLAVFASLALAESPSTPDTTQAQVSTR